MNKQLPQQLNLYAPTNQALFYERKCFWRRQDFISKFIMNLLFCYNSLAQVVFAHSLVLSIRSFVHLIFHSVSGILASCLAPIFERVLLIRQPLSASFPPVSRADGDSRRQSVEISRDQFATIGPTSREMRNVIKTRYDSTLWALQNV